MGAETVTVRELVNELLEKYHRLDDEVLIDTPATLNAGTIEEVRSGSADGREFVVLQVSIDSERGRAGG